MSTSMKEIRFAISSEATPYGPLIQRGARPPFVWVRRPSDQSEGAGLNN